MPIDPDVVAYTAPVRYYSEMGPSGALPEGTCRIDIVEMVQRKTTSQGQLNDHRIHVSQVAAVVPCELSICDPCTDLQAQMTCWMDENLIRD